MRERGEGEPMAVPFVGRAEELETLADLDRRVAEEGAPARR
jgi:hypothetical protein